MANLKEATVGEPHGGFRVFFYLFKEWTEKPPRRNCRNWLASPLTAAWFVTMEVEASSLPDRAMARIHA